MPLPSTIDSYHPEFENFKKALEDPTGCRIAFASESKATQARFRLHQARALDRQQSMRVYPKDHKLYGKSEYDVLVLKLREDTEGKWWVYIERHGRDILAVESLSEVE